MPLIPMPPTLLEHGGVDREANHWRARTAMALEAIVKQGAPAVAESDAAREQFDRLTAEITSLTGSIHVEQEKNARLNREAHDLAKRLERSGHALEQLRGKLGGEDPATLQRHLDALREKSIALEAKVDEQTEQVAALRGARDRLQQENKALAETLTLERAKSAELNRAVIREITASEALRATHKADTEATRMAMAALAGERDSLRGDVAKLTRTGLAGVSGENVNVVVAVDGERVKVCEVFTSPNLAREYFAEMRNIWGGANVALCNRRVDSSATGAGSFEQAGSTSRRVRADVIVITAAELQRLQAIAAHGGDVTLEVPWKVDDVEQAPPGANVHGLGPDTDPGAPAKDCPRETPCNTAGPHDEKGCDVEGVRWLQGWARCHGTAPQCQHRWMAVVETHDGVDPIALQCPGCLLNRGQFETIVGTFAAESAAVSHARLATTQDELAGAKLREAIAVKRADLLDEKLRKTTMPQIVRDTVAALIDAAPAPVTDEERDRWVEARHHARVRLGLPVPTDTTT